jgi:hypothetical protein
MRTIKVDGRTWSVKVGKDWMEARSGNTKLAVPLSQVTGRSPDTLERGRWKKTSDGMVTPDQIAAANRRHTITPPKRHR